MSNLTEEQIRAEEQWKIAADQFFREAIFAVAEKVDQKIYDPFVFEVGKQIYSTFKAQNFPPKSREGSNEV